MQLMEVLTPVYVNRSSVSYILYNCTRGAVQLFLCIRMKTGEHNENYPQLSYIH